MLGKLLCWLLNILLRIQISKLLHFPFTQNTENQKELLGLPIYDIESIHKDIPASGYYLFVALSSNHLNRDKKLYYELKEKGYNFASYVSSKAFVWDNVEIGRIASF